MKTVMDQLAHAQGRQDEVPNQDLARDLAATGNVAGIQEIVDGLQSENRNIQNDCIKVIYEIGYIKPELIADYTDELLGLLRDKNNRLVWGGMAALATIAEIKADELFRQREEIQRAIKMGSVITQDRGIAILARVAAQKSVYRAELLPDLIAHIKTCRPKDVPQRAEQIVMAVDAQHKPQFLQVLESRRASLKSSQLKRLQKVVKEAGTRS